MNLTGLRAHDRYRTEHAGGSQQVLHGGRWVRGPGGVLTWHEARAVSDVRAEDVRTQLQAGRVNVHDLRACTTCPARVDEHCRTADGERAHKPHAGRLTPRLCPCGELPLGTSRHCGGCAFMTLTTPKAISVRNAVLRERVA